MSEMAYHRAPDALSPTALRILAKDLQVGDTIITPGIIPVTVEKLRHYTDHHLVVADYICSAGCGARTLVAETMVQILPRRKQEAH
jgi:hypothetical protein